MLCVYLTNFEPDCPIKVGIYQKVHGIYSLEFCGYFTYTMTYDQMIRMIQKYLCVFNQFPDYVRVIDFIPTTTNL